MSSHKIAVYAICKNEEQFVDRWVDSMEEADGIFVTDTGSQDSTCEKLKKRNVPVFSVRPGVWRFDDARNISLALVPEDYDICVCTDLDEVLSKGWRNLLENAWKENTTRLRYMYTWSFNADGTPAVTFRYEKIHLRNNYRWTHPVHEVLSYYGEHEVYAYEDRIHLKHYPDSGKSRGQYLHLLELSVKEQPYDDRNLHYLGREYMFYGMWDKCIETLKKHLALKTALWKDERSASMRFIARAYMKKGELDESRSWLFKAIAEAPYLREPYVEAARLAYIEKDWERVYFMVSEALKIKNKPLSYINESSSWDYTPYDLGAISSYNLGLYDKALYFAEEALKFSPDNERLKNNLAIIKSKMQDCT